MKKLFVFLTVSILLMSCGSDFVKMRVRTISDQSIIRLKIHKSIAQYYEEGDTVTIYTTSDSYSSWEIENNSRTKDESKYHEGFYYYTNESKTDSSYIPGYVSIYKNVVIEKILE